ncbi:hypothetical protein GCM10010219_25780 [Streptomyces netropsis]|nr:hypothetical protein GCM10010219_25780 [Streptomyces netropsis]
MGWTDRFTPPASATSHAPDSMLWHARWMAVNDDEHIVSTLMLGPWKSKKYDTRLATAEGLPDSATELPRTCSCAP